jgi:hypothetical protein
MQQKNEQKSDEKKDEQPSGFGLSYTPNEAEDDAELLAAAIRAWQHLRSGLNSSNFADRLRDEGWSPDGPPAAALTALMQRSPYREHFYLRNGLWHLTPDQAPPPPSLPLP